MLFDCYKLCYFQSSQFVTDDIEVLKKAVSVLEGLTIEELEESFYYDDDDDEYTKRLIDESFRLQYLSNYQLFTLKNFLKKNNLFKNGKVDAIMLLSSETANTEGK